MYSTAIVKVLAIIVLVVSTESKSFRSVYCNIKKFNIASSGVCPKVNDGSMKLCRNLCNDEEVSVQEECSMSPECCWTGESCVFKVTHPDVKALKEELPEAPAAHGSDWKEKGRVKRQLGSSGMVNDSIIRQAIESLMASIRNMQQQNAQQSGKGFTFSVPVGGQNRINGQVRLPGPGFLPSAGVQFGTNVLRGDLSIGTSFNVDVPNKPYGGFRLTIPIGNSGDD